MQRQAPFRAAAPPIRLISSVSPPSKPIPQSTSPNATLGIPLPRHESVFSWLSTTPPSTHHIPGAVTASVGSPMNRRKSMEELKRAESANAAHISSSNSHSFSIPLVPAHSSLFMHSQRSVPGAVVAHIRSSADSVPGLPPTPVFVRSQSNPVVLDATSPPPLPPEYIQPAGSPVFTLELPRLAKQQRRQSPTHNTPPTTSVVPHIGHSPPLPTPSPPLQKRGTPRSDGMVELADGLEERLEDADDEQDADEKCNSPTGAQLPPSFPFTFHKSQVKSSRLRDLSLPTSGITATERASTRAAPSPMHRILTDDTGEQQSPPPPPPPILSSEETQQQATSPPSPESSAKQVATLLTQHGLGKYLPKFVVEEVTMENIFLLTPDDLKEMGLAIGPRRTLLHELELLRPKPLAECCKMLRASDIANLCDMTAANLIHDAVPQRKLGQGNFGQVWEGTWGETTRVAMKTVNDTGISCKDFVAEAEVLRALRHPNILQYYGLAESGGVVYILMELADGCVRNLILEEGENISLPRLINMAMSCAAGMSYLADNHIIHRDLACRNLLYKREGTNFVVQVCDFGLSRHLDTDYYEVHEALPVKWTAWEVLAFRKYTTWSDVWSFGVVLWELLSYGIEPYPGVATSDVFDWIQKGHRMNPPEDCPETLYQLMLACWNTEPRERPLFREIYHTLATFLKTLPESGSPTDGDADGPLSPTTAGSTRGRCHSAGGRRGISGGSSGSMSVSTSETESQSRTSSTYADLEDSSAPGTPRLGVASAYALVGNRDAQAVSEAYADSPVLPSPRQAYVEDFSASASQCAGHSTIAESPRTPPTDSDGTYVDVGSPAPLACSARTPSPVT
eukprot:TRINITY_DN4979_c0_g1_i4.p1 TRINITY_DN4979_c0_g1~~TRINITY_DN4979_c0_g1_i4.p1  ORF type:complete len:960 (+),score=160.85 TRINITY_DN4979_c0_g1_i4:325-2880(+)